MEHTIEFWSRRLGRQIDEEEAIRAIENVAVFYRLLDEFDRELKPSATTMPHNGEH